MEKAYLAVIEALGKVLMQKEYELSVLKFENEQLKNKIETIEKYCDSLKEN